MHHLFISAWFQDQYHTCIYQPCILATTQKSAFAYSLTKVLRSRLAFQSRRPLKPPEPAQFVCGKSGIFYG